MPNARQCRFLPIRSRYSVPCFVHRSLDAWDMSLFCKTGRQTGALHLACILHASCMVASTEVSLILILHFMAYCSAEGEHSQVSLSSRLDRETVPRRAQGGLGEGQKSRKRNFLAPFVDYRASLKRENPPAGAYIDMRSLTRPGQLGLGEIRAGSSTAVTTRRRRARPRRRRRPPLMLDAARAAAVWEVTVEARRPAP